MPAPPAPPPQVSVITTGPAGAPLQHSFQSLLDQSLLAWEWIVVTSDAAWRPSPDDRRVRLVLDDRALEPGPAKALAANVALAGICVELDAGDRLAPGALGAVVETFESDPAAGLVYSDFSPARDGLDPGDGWSFRRELAGGRAYDVVASMAPTPHNVSYPSYAPAHLRAFRRDGYEAVGGFETAPDHLVFEHDLVCRLYQRFEFRHLPMCLYIEGGPPAARAEPGALHRASGEQYHRHVQPNALAWAARLGLDALDLGPGACPPGYRPAGYRAGHGFDAAESSVGVIRAVDFLQTVTNPVAFWNEAYRVLAPAGLLLSITPVGPGRDEPFFWRLASAGGRPPGVSHRLQLSWLSSFEGPDKGPPYVCANLIAVKDGPRQGGFLDV